jgi:hypothetical protein
MNSLESRKRLLVAESELNRAHLAQEWTAAVDGVHSLSGQARTITSAAVAAGSLVAGLVAFRRARSASAGGKVHWWQSLLKGGLLAFSLWARSRPREKS